MNKKVVKRSFLPYVLLFLIIISIMYFVSVGNKNVNIITYDEFMKYADKGDIKEIEITPKNRASVYEISGTLKKYDKGETFFLRVPLQTETIAKIYEAEENHSFKITTENDPGSSTFLLFLINVLPMILLIGLAFWFITRQMGGANKSMDFGKSKARLAMVEEKLILIKLLD